MKALIRMFVALALLLVLAGCQRGNRGGQGHYDQDTTCREEAYR